MAQKTSALVWLRQDLRLTDQPALYAASQADQGFAVFIWDKKFENSGIWGRGEASRWWLYESLQALSQAFENMGSKLILVQGDTAEVLIGLVAKLEITHVYWNRRYHKQAIEYDSKVETQLRAKGVELRTFAGNYLLEPGDLTNQSGSPYRVFTPFSKALLTLDLPIRSLPQVTKLSMPPVELSNWQVESLLPAKNWYRKLSSYWQPGEAGAKQSLKRFITKGLANYQRDRDFPAIYGSSRLSPHLHFGEISPRTVWSKLFRLESDQNPDVFPYLRQLIWREFANYCLYHFPDMPDQSLRPEFESFPWAKNHKSHLHSWQRGLTGFPIVDAGMRELWETGWMHNRVRMIVGSFLVKNLRVHWLEGEKWFWDTLIDADLPNNSMGWQWVAGSGIDAAPYFRIFNPSLQSQKFDPEGEYIRHWLPELKKLPSKWIHAPGEAPQQILHQAEVKLGETYPRPIIDYRQSRADALEAYDSIKAGRASV